MDLVKLVDEGDKVLVRRLSYRHHLLARALAEGITQRQAAARTGYSEQRVSLLLTDPAFIELVETYRLEADAKWFDMQDRIAALGATAVDELQTRIEESPEKVTNQQLIDIASRMADRSGFGPSSKSEVNVNVDIANRLDAARRRAEKLRAAEVVEAEIVNGDDV